MDSGGTAVIPQGATVSPELANPEDQKARELTKYHVANPDQIERMARCRAATEDLIMAIVRNCPANADRSAAIRKARECLMTANAAIVLPAGVTDF